MEAASWWRSIFERARPPWASGLAPRCRPKTRSNCGAALFAASLFFIPLVEPLQHLRYAYGPALIAVGVLMLGSIRNIDFQDMTELVPAFVTIAVMVFTYNVANGLTAGLVLWPVFKIVTGRAREVKAGSAVLGLLCLIYFIFGLPH